VQSFEMTAITSSLAPGAQPAQVQWGTIAVLWHHGTTTPCPQCECLLRLLEVLHVNTRLGAVSTCNLSSCAMPPQVHLVDGEEVHWFSRQVRRAFGVFKPCARRCRDDTCLINLCTCPSIRLLTYHDC
jgi:hypothetical protein